ncbi:hypothetical protein [Mesorhizobium sp. CAU 1741]|uniref:hypothetical protein n=1 Tax=Mesorhizobium sp. CAU 1741 TaxID=3140366 RepID=UPI00325B5C3E
MLDDELIQDFSFNFLGYGSAKPRIVFIGMEEGGGNSLEEVAKRLNAWEALGRPRLADIREYHSRIGMPQLFCTAGYRRQNTWQGLIKLYRNALGIPIKDLNAFQRDEWCGPDSDVASIELFPLPSPSINKWLYADWTRVPEIRVSRKTYYRFLFERRATLIRDFIKRATPSIVVMYGLKHKKWFETLFYCDRPQLMQKGVYIFPNISVPSTTLICHPAYASNLTLECAGNSAADRAFH